MKVECINNLEGQNFLTVGKYYDVISDEGSHWNVRNDEGSENWYPKEHFAGDTHDMKVESADEAGAIDAHYSSFEYVLPCNMKKGDVIKIDPYFVSKTWRLGSKDDSGILFHCLKTLARYSEKNSREREILALYKQVKRLAQLEGVELV